jgi:hypothetical protein
MAGTLGIAHDSRGRLRLRLPPDADVEGVEEAVAGLEGVSRVTWQPRTRSLLVLYDAAAQERANLIDTVAQHTDVTLPDLPATSDPRPPLTTLLARPIEVVNRRLHRMSHGHANLRTLAPALLVAWAAAELLRGRLAPLSWSSALWYAHGLFRDYSLGGPE